MEDAYLRANIGLDIGVLLDIVVCRWTGSVVIVQ